jgi:hypothetical protein
MFQLIVLCQYINGVVGSDDIRVPIQMHRGPQSSNLLQVQVFGNTISVPWGCDSRSYTLHSAHTQINCRCIPGFLHDRSHRRMVHTIVRRIHSFEMNLKGESSSSQIASYIPDSDYVQILAVCRPFYLPQNCHLAICHLDSTMSSYAL